MARKNPAAGRPPVPAEVKEHTRGEAKTKKAIGGATKAAKLGEAMKGGVKLGAKNTPAKKY